MCTTPNQNDNNENNHKKMKNIWKVCAGVEEEGENQEVYVKTLANQTCSGELFLLDNDYD